MKRNLAFKLLLCFLITVITMFILLNTYGAEKFKSSVLDKKKAILYEEASLISSEYMDNFYSEDITLATLSKQLRTIDTFLNVRIWIINSIGEIICDTESQRNSLIMLNINDVAPTFLEQSFSDNTYIQGVINNPSISVIYPLTYKYEVRGYVVLHTALSEIEKEVITYTNAINLCILIFTVIMLFVFLYLYKITAFPLKVLRKAAIEYTSGNYVYKLKIKGEDEFKDLADAIVYMAGELNSLDDYQKKFVANISHDFRSPLTSIKGYAEAILDGTIPYEMQGKYLDIIVFEAERLNKLTNNLIELNSFGQKGSLLDITSFDINHVIKKTVASFEGICTKRKIMLNLVFSSKELYVDADMGKIQQVLYNLVDNAIKFSHNNSKIKISVSEKSDKVFVAVKDYGIGIPKDSILKIWERFYKTDTSRGKDKKGTGLGLSISKEIIQAHNENITVISTEGVGTEFTFSLTKTEED